MACPDAVKRLIRRFNHQSDQLVYQLYGLTDEEINHVEQSTQPAGD